jgi:hypothetical protein
MVSFQPFNLLGNPNISATGLGNEANTRAVLLLPYFPPPQPIHSGTALHVTRFSMGGASFHRWRSFYHSIF